MDGDALKAKNASREAPKPTDWPKIKETKITPQEIFGRDFEAKQDAGRLSPGARYRKDPASFGKTISESPNRKAILDQYGDYLNDDGREELVNYLFDDAPEDSEWEDGPDYGRISEIVGRNPWDAEELARNYDDYKYDLSLPDDPRDLFGSDRYDRIMGDARERRYDPEGDEADEYWKLRQEGYL